MDLPKEKVGARSSGIVDEYNQGKRKNKKLPCGESNPGHGGESAGS